MKPTHFIKAIFFTLLIIWVGTGNASFNRKCCKVIKQTKVSIKTSATNAVHFAPFDVLKW